MSGKAELVTIKFACDLAMPYLDAFKNSPPEHATTALVLFLSLLTTQLSRTSRSDSDAASLMQMLADDVINTLEHNPDMVEAIFKDFEGT